MTIQEIAQKQIDQPAIRLHFARNGFREHYWFDESSGSIRSYSGRRVTFDLYDLAATDWVVASFARWEKL
jgi:hypothetical protein